MAEAQPVIDNEGDKTLPELYTSIVTIQEEIETTEDSTSCDKNQIKLKDGIEMAELAIQMVNELSLFSVNEDIDEVQTEQIKYMLLSAYLGYFTCLNCHMARKLAVQKTIMCYKDFLRLCRDYNVVDHNVDVAVEEDEEEGIENIRPVVSRRQGVDAQSVNRNNKIQRFKDKKALQTKLTELRQHVEKEHVDDEMKREYYLTQVKQWANYAVDEIDSSALEMQMLKHRDELKKSGQSGVALPNKNTNKSKAFRPFILTRNALQKKVMGAGYPATPCMTVDEFYNQKVLEGSLTEGPQGHSMQNWAQDPDKDARDRDEEDAEKEKKIEEDDEENIARMRYMDEWKDDHRRGDGNRHNKG